MDAKQLFAMSNADLAKHFETVRDELVRRQDYQGASLARSLMMHARYLADLEGLETQWSQPAVPEKK